MEVRFVMSSTSSLISSIVASRVATIIFATHPIHVEAVTSLVGRADCLCGLFYILSIIFYDVSLQTSSSNTPQTKSKSRGNYIFLAISLIFGWIASLSKEVGITGKRVLTCRSSGSC